MSYLRKISSLKEKASAQVAINFCQENSFMEVALCLERPTYGAFLDQHESIFVNDPEKLSAWAEMKEATLSAWAKMKEANMKRYTPWCSGVFLDTLYVDDKVRKDQWDAAIDEQCQRLTKGLPQFLKHGVHAWINRISLEYLCYSLRQEVLFGVSRYFLMDVFTRGDWTDAGRLDEKKLAKRLVRDKRLTALQRYRIACVYCLHITISQLWKRLTQKEKDISKDGYTYFPQESHGLVLLWSQQMDSHREKKVTRRKKYRWTSAAELAMHYGNRASLISCWKRLKEDVRQQMVMDMALQSFEKWQSKNVWQTKWYDRQKLFNADLPKTQSDESMKHFNLPYYYSELVSFFLSEMDEEQQLTFFKKAFQKSYCDSVLESFLDWPHQDDFLPTINRLWGIIPKFAYVQCLLTLAHKYSEEDEKENRYYDYRSLLWMLWENTPEVYKQYVFRESNDLVTINDYKLLFPQLLKRSPFQKQDETLFKRFFCYQPPQKRRAMMRSEVGKDICSLLMQNEKWSFVNWLLEDCLSKEEIPNFKKQFIQSDCGRKLCCSKLQENREKLVEDLIDWSVALDTEKMQFKYELIKGKNFLYVCKTFLSKGNFAQVERMINFCLSSDEMKKQFKVHFAKYTCGDLLKDSITVWEHMDKILAWSTDAEEKIKDLKRDLFSDIGINIHYELVFTYKQWDEVECFYKWFGLSPEEIKKLKKDTIFTPQAIVTIEEDCYYCTEMDLLPLQYCLTDQEMVFDLKKKVEEKCFEHGLYKEDKEQLDYLMSKLLHSFQKDVVQDKTSSVFIEDKGEKRSIATEDESNSPRSGLSKTFKRNMT